MSFPPLNKDLASFTLTLTPLLYRQKAVIGNTEDVNSEILLRITLLPVKKRRFAHLYLCDVKKTKLPTLIGQLAIVMIFCAILGSIPLSGPYPL